MEKSLAEKVIGDLQNKQYDGKDFVVEIASKDGKRTKGNSNRKPTSKKRNQRDNKRAKRKR